MSLAEDIALLHRVFIGVGILVQLDVEFQQALGGAERPDTEIVDPVIDLRIFGGIVHLSLAETTGVRNFMHLRLR